MDYNHVIDVEFIDDINKAQKPITNLPIVLHKYIRLHKNISKEIWALEKEYDSLYAQKYKFYKEEYDEFVLKETEVRAYAKGSPELLEIQQALEEKKIYKNSLEMCISAIKDLNWIFKNKIEYDKLYSLNGE